MWLWWWTSWTPFSYLSFWCGVYMWLEKTNGIQILFPLIMRNSMFKPQTQKRNFSLSSYSMLCSVNPSASLLQTKTQNPTTRSEKAYLRAELSDLNINYSSAWTWRSVWSKALKSHFKSRISTVCIMMQIMIVLGWLFLVWFSDGYFF